MISKTSFIKIIDILDEYFNGEMAEARKKLGIYDCRENDLMDILISAISADMDPDNKALNDDFISPCGDYIGEYLFGCTEFQEQCPNGDALYDYIIKQYQSKEKM